ncbi:hypothetical protein ElyMa_005494900 [Elysia marginata]|uniref:Reverse transcriptase domain-containing protein n=1 Tax=Elysia marginata TaxID=1093978 RepID=A0AAV4ES30_9GAST|nr:hypothetical protein ElyMa_005494900 [Elysia marginata]
MDKAVPPERKARVRTQHFKSRTQNMKHGVPQGGIVSNPLLYVHDGYSDDTSQGCLWRNVRRRYDHMGNIGIHWNRTGAPTTGTRGPKNVDRKMADENKP